MRSAHCAWFSTRTAGRSCGQHLANSSPRYFFAVRYQNKWYSRNRRRGLPAPRTLKTGKYLDNLTTAQENAAPALRGGIQDNRPSARPGRTWRRTPLMRTSAFFIASAIPQIHLLSRDRQAHACDAAPALPNSGQGEGNARPGRADGRYERRRHGAPLEHPPLRQVEIRD